MFRSSLAMFVPFVSMLACSAPAPMETPVVVASNQQSPQAIASDGTTIFWADTNASGCAISSVPVSGGAPTQLAYGGYDVQDIAVDADAIYWTDFTVGIGGIRKVSRAGGDVVTLLTAEGNPWVNPHHLVVADGWIYFTNSASDDALPLVAKMPVTGGKPTLLAQAGEPDEIAVDATSVYFTDSVLGTVNAVPRDGGSVVVLASGQSNVTRIAIDAANAYWVSAPFGDDTAQTIRSVPLRGGDARDLVSATKATNMACDGTALYWFDAPHGGEARYVLNKLVLASGDKTELAATDDSVGALTVDATRVIWTGLVSGTIEAVAK